MAQTLTKPTFQTKSTFLKDSKNTNPIEHYKSIWGMKDIELKFSPEALEVIANQATMQNAGQEGIHCILEKLFLNLKFDMPPDITTVEISEDVIMGRAPPNYQRKCGTRKVSKKLLLTAIDEDEETDENFLTGSEFSGNGNFACSSIAIGQGFCSKYETTTIHGPSTSQNMWIRLIFKVLSWLVICNCNFIAYLAFGCTVCGSDTCP